MKKREPEDYGAEKRNLMYSQIFNYNMNRDGTRNIEVSAAVESGGKSITSKRNRNIGLVVLVVVIVLLFGWSFLHQDIAMIISHFMLETKGEEMNLLEPEPIRLDMDAFLKEANESNDYYTGEAEKYHYQYYNLWSKVPLDAGSEDHTVEGGKLNFTWYELRVYEKDKLGTIEIIVKEDGILKDVQYELHGTFKIADYTEEGTVLADKGDLATFLFEAEDGNKAYFIRNWTYGTYTVYFVVDDIMFEMEIPNSKKAVENAEKIFEAMTY